MLLLKGNFSQVLKWNGTSYNRYRVNTNILEGPCSSSNENSYFCSVNKIGKIHVKNDKKNVFGSRNWQEILGFGTVCRHEEHPNSSF